MRISPHLHFDGQCRAAFTRYHQLLGGQLRMLTFGDPPMAAEVDPKWHDRIVHVTLQLGDLELAGADALPQEYATPQGCSVLLTFEDSAKGEHVFNELARVGRVRFRFQRTLWSSGFGVLVDEFGVPWEVSCDESTSPNNRLQRTVRAKVPEVKRRRPVAEQEHYVLPIAEDTLHEYLLRKEECVRRRKA